jgi:hypothetical protein
MLGPVKGGMAALHRLSTRAAAGAEELNSRLAELFAANNEQH